MFSVSSSCFSIWFSVLTSVRLEASSYGRNKLRLVDRFYDVIERTFLHASNRAVNIIDGRDHDDGDFRMTAHDLVEKLEARDKLHVYVQRDQRIILAFQKLVDFPLSPHVSTLFMPLEDNVSLCAEKKCSSSSTNKIGFDGKFFVFIIHLVVIVDSCWKGNVCSVSFIGLARKYKRPAMAFHDII